MEMTFKVDFIWKGSGWLLQNGTAEALLQNVLVDSYNKLCKVMNPLLDKWNSEAEALGIEGSVDPASDYMMFMHAKYTEVLVKMINEGQLWRHTMYKTGYYYDPELNLHLTFEVDDNRLEKSSVDVSFGLVPA